MVFKDYKDLMITKAADLLISKGYFIADSFGYEIEVEDLSYHKEIGILVELPRQIKVPRKYIFGRRLRQYIAKVDFSNSTKSKKITINVYGRENVESIKQIAKEFEKKFECEATINIISEYRHWENYGPYSNYI